MDEADFQQAMLARPDDASLRLAFSDWLEERGDPRAELLRLLHTLTQSTYGPDRPAQEERLRALMAAGVAPVGPFWTNGVGMRFAWIPAGTFLMGSPPNEEGRGDDEFQHRVTLSCGFFMGVTPVTQAEWQAVVGINPSCFKGDKRPVEQVSWDDCQEFCRLLNQKDGKKYRLPTEAEWEYACRAGTTTPFSYGETLSTDQANYDGTCTYGRGCAGQHRQQTTLVGNFPPNAWGLYDMHGNGLEWCSDWYGDYPRGHLSDPSGVDNGRDRVLRGGSWYEDPGACRSGCRISWAPGNRGSGVGVRVCFCLD